MVFGLSGWLNWLYLPNPEPVRRRAVVFHPAAAVLPGLSAADAPAARRSGWSLALFALLLLALLLSERVRYGHMLWFTAFSFCFGGTCQPALAGGWKHSLLLLTALVSGFVLAWWLFGAPLKGLLLVGLASLLAIQLLLSVALPDWLHAPFRPFGACVLEIYFLHTYLFVHLSGMPIPDLLASLALILAASLATRALAERL